MMDYKTALCTLIWSLGGEVIIPRDALDDEYVLHYFEDEKEITIVAEVKKA